MLNHVLSSLLAFLISNCFFKFLIVPLLGLFFAFAGIASSGLLAMAITVVAALAVTVAIYDYAYAFSKAIVSAIVGRDSFAY